MKKKKKIVQPIKEIEIINRRTHKIRKIIPADKEMIIYNQQLNEFQLLSNLSASYESSSEP